MTFHFPLNLEQNNFFKHILFPMFEEYKLLKNNFKIIKNRNSTYPRLADSDKRGKPAALELLATILKNKNINNKMPFSVLYQLDSTRDFHHNDGLYYIDADKDVYQFSFLTLDEGTAKYQEQVIEHLLTFISSLDLNHTEIMKVIHHLARI